MMLASTKARITTASVGSQCGMMMPKVLGGHVGTCGGERPKQTSRNVVGAHAGADAGRINGWCVGAGGTE